MRHSWKYSEKDKPKGEGGRRRKGWAQGETTESYIKKQGGGGTQMTGHQNVNGRCSKVEIGRRVKGK